MGRVALSFLSQMRFGDGAALKAFALEHRLAHDQFAGAISTADAIATPNFDVGDARAHSAWEILMLDPKEAPAQARDALQAWLLLHSQLHQAEYDALGLGDVGAPGGVFDGEAYDLATVDMAKADEFNVWMQQHQQVHDIEADALGITA